MTAPRPSALPDNAPLLDPDALALALGGSPDSFTGDLLRLIEKAQATPANREALRVAFPRQLRAWELWRGWGTEPTAGELLSALDTDPAARPHADPVARAAVVAEFLVLAESAALTPEARGMTALAAGIVAGRLRAEWEQAGPGDVEYVAASAICRQAEDTFHDEGRPADPPCERCRAAARAALAIYVAAAGATDQPAVDQESWHAVAAEWRAAASAWRDIVRLVQDAAHEAGLTPDVIRAECRHRRLAELDARPARPEPVAEREHPGGPGPLPEVPDAAYPADASPLEPVADLGDVLRGDVRPDPGADR